MASAIYGNPIRMEAAGTAWSGELKKVRLIQWVDNAADIVNDSTIVLTINGVALTTKLQMVADTSNFGVVVWEIGPFNDGVPVDSFVVTTMGTGELHIWVE